MSQVLGRLQLAKEHTCKSPKKKEKRKHNFSLAFSWVPLLNKLAIK